MAYAWANLAGANGFDVTKLKEAIEPKVSSEDKSEAQKLTRQFRSPVRWCFGGK